MILCPDKRVHFRRRVSASRQAGHRAGAETAASSLRAPSLPAGVQRAIATLTSTVSNSKFSRWEQTYDLKDPQTAKLFTGLGLNTP